MDDIDLTLLPAEIADAVAVAQRHRSVTGVRIATMDEELVVVEVDIDCELPSQFRPHGHSETGVRIEEAAAFHFFKPFPGSAPHVTLRADFNTNLPHINPHRAGDPVPPCVLFGRPMELYHVLGFKGLLDQTVLWLKKAGRDELMNPDQGWEPPRRGAVDDKLVFDLPQICGLSGKKEGGVWFKCLFAQRQLQDKPPGRALGSVLDIDAIAISADNIDEIFTGSSNEKILKGQSLVLACWPGKLPSGEPKVCGTYLPDTVSTLGELYQRAEIFGCATVLRDRLTWLARCAGQIKKKYNYPIYLLLCARRPIPMTESGLHVEVVAYRLNVGFPDFLPHGDATPVFPVSHRHPVNPELLRKMSGIDPAAPTPNVTMLGCGSVGSKLALHMSRAGFVPNILADSADLSPHNMARHALFPQARSADSLCPAPKSVALAEALKPFGKNPTAYEGDLIYCEPTSNTFKEMFPPGTALIVNSTGSHAVTEHLASTPALPARVAEASLMDEGNLGIWTLEGPDRNPNTLDLATITYAEIRSLMTGDQVLAAYSDSDGRMPIGQGCESVTAIMSDAQISMHSAAMGKRLIEVLQNGLPGQGEILMGQTEEDGLSTKWTKLAIGPTQEVVAENDLTWRIRILDRAHQKIFAEVAGYPAVETGGVIVGRVSQVNRLIHIVDVIPAPPDSKRSAQLFELGVEGLTAQAEQVEQSSAGTLWCLGTWHSHLEDQGGSKLDYDTAHSLEGKGHRAMVLLIRRPLGYSAIVVPGG